MLDILPTFFFIMKFQNIYKGNYMFDPTRNTKVLPFGGFYLFLSSMSLENFSSLQKGINGVFLQNKLRNSYHILRLEMIDNTADPIGKKDRNKV